MNFFEKMKKKFHFVAFRFIIYVSFTYQKEKNQSPRILFDFSYWTYHDGNKLSLYLHFSVIDINPSDRRSKEERRKEGITLIERNIQDTWAFHLAKALNVTRRSINRASSVRLSLVSFDVICERLCVCPSDRFLPLIGCK